MMAMTGTTKQSVTSEVVYERFGAMEDLLLGIAITEQRSACGVVGL